MACAENELDIAIGLFAPHTQHSSPPKMLNKDSSWLSHFSQNAALILVSLFFLPLDTFILIASYGIQILVPQNVNRRRVRRFAHFYPKTILVTGVGMAKGLKIARSFYETGHRVIGADFEPYGIQVNGRYSKSLSKFYRLSKPSSTYGAASYIQDLIDLVRKEKVDLWISCSGVASAVEDGQAKEMLERKTVCKCIQFDVKTTSTLDEKDSFIRYTANIGLPIPETHEVRSRAAIHQVLHGARDKKFIMKSVGLDDSTRGDMTLLPRRTLSQTYHHVSNIRVSKDQPWVLQQFVRGEKYCAQALVVHGEVKAFVACPSSELLMHYQALPPESGLSRAMLNFTREFAEKGGPKMTGHLSFDFLVDEIITEQGLEKKILPIVCNPRAHTAVVLFEGQNSDMVSGYLSALTPEANGTVNGHEEQIAFAKSVNGYYWIGHDLVSHVLHPFLRLLRGRIGALQYIQGCVTFLNHMLFWKDGTYEVWDPLPWWWLYHVYWPGQFLMCILYGKRWSRLNVSTTKMFGC